MVNKAALQRATVVAVFAGLLIIFFRSEIHKSLDLSYIQQNKQHFLKYYEQNQILSILYFFVTYLAMAALSLPGATVLTLLGGALFGFTTAFITTSFASTMGASIAFLASRFLFRDFIQSRFKSKLDIINEGVKKEGAFYLFSLRLIPIFPFWAINSIFGLTPISLKSFYITSQIGMLPGTIVYVYAGTQIGGITNIKDILSPNLVIALILIGVLPITTKKLLTRFKARRKSKLQNHS